MADSCITTVTSDIFCERRILSATHLVAARLEAGVAKGAGAVGALIHQPAGSHGITGPEPVSPQVRCGEAVLSHLHLQHRDLHLGPVEGGHLVNGEITMTTPGHPVVTFHRQRESAVAPPVAPRGKSGKD